MRHGSRPVLSLAGFAWTALALTAVGYSEPAADRPVNVGLNCDWSANQEASLATLRTYSIRLLGGLAATAAAGLAVLIFVKRRPTVRAASSERLILASQVFLNPRSRVAVLQVGTNRVLVGHDATGIRSMLLLPDHFDDLWEEPLSNDAESILPVHPCFTRSGQRFLEVGDSGWDLNHRTS